MFPKSPQEIKAPIKAPINWANKYKSNFLCLLSMNIPIVTIGLIYPPVIYPDWAIARKRADAMTTSGAKCFPDVQTP